MTSPQLSADDQRDLRDAASDAWKQSGGKYLRSALLFRQDNRVKQIAKLDPATIFLLLQIAYKIWQWWKANKVSDPSLVASAGEPTFGASE